MFGEGMWYICLADLSSIDDVKVMVRVEAWQHRQML